MSILECRISGCSRAHIVYAHNGIGSAVKKAVRLRIGIGWLERVTAEVIIFIEAVVNAIPNLPVLQRGEISAYEAHAAAMSVFFRSNGATFSDV